MGLDYDRLIKMKKTMPDMIRYILPLALILGASEKL